MNNNKISALVDSHNNQVAKTDSEKAELLIILKKWMKRETEMSEYPGVFEMRQGEITEEEMIEAMRHISSHKAQGPDDQEWWTEVIPLDTWKMANIVPIAKPDRDHSICKNHRHIALLSGVGKLMERI
ncbi:hypothetical protein RFI_21683, partial [Reticulomyxa filosa]